jgi:hypothetical protein
MRLYIKKICSCLGLLTISIHKHEHIVLNVLSHEHHEHLCLVGSHPKVPLGGLTLDDDHH